MIDLNLLNDYRNRLFEIEMYKSHSTSHYADSGCFSIPVKGVRKGLTVVASSGRIEASDGWDHVSVSLKTRCPTWDEMCKIKDLFFEPEDATFQLHPAKSENISNQRYCLHLWRNIHAPMMLPPAHMVGVKSLGDVTHNPHVRSLLDAYHEGTLE